jgi:ribonuclease PH
LRPVDLESDVQMHAEGSVIITLGHTRVLCAVSIENRVPRFLRGTGAGWVTAEYAMLPRATNTRSDRESMRTSGRTHEIQRLIGRSLRAVTDLDILGERTFTVDCDVLQADGGTRTAAITGGYVALHHAMQRLVVAGEYAAVPLRMPVAATSVGVVQGDVLLDLCYEEDSGADVDLNVVKTGDGEYIEVQGTAEGSPFARRLLNEMLDVADAGLEHLFEMQRKQIAAATAP